MLLDHVAQPVEPGVAGGTEADRGRLSAQQPGQQRTPQRVALEAAWGYPEDDTACRDGAFRFAAVRRGNALVALQPERGTAADRGVAAEIKTRGLVRLGVAGPVFYQDMDTLRAEVQRADRQTVDLHRLPRRQSEFAAGVGLREIDQRDELRRRETSSRRAAKLTASPITPIRIAAPYPCGPDGQAKSTSSSQSLLK